MTTVDFYSLPRQVQDRLVASFRAEFDPKPIVHRRSTRPTVLAWLALSAAASLLLIGLWVVGYGDLDSSLSRHARPFDVLYALLAAALALGMVQALACRVARRGLPFVPGIYLFPANLIDGRERTLRVFPLDQAKVTAGAAPGTVTVAFGEQRFSFVVEASKRPETLEALRVAAERAATALEPAERLEIDPLVPPLVASPLATDVPFAPRRPPWLRARWLLVAAAAFGGVALHLLRDRGSDARMFAASRARDDVATYQRYLTRGTAERTLVARVLLPKAALRAAVGEGSVEAVERFIAEYPDTDIQNEVAAARRAALEAALERARRAGTLAALVDFAERYPEHGLAQPLARARHSVYARALDRQRAKIPKQNGGVARFVERLVAACERLGARKTGAAVRGPTVLVRVRRQPSRGFDLADEVVATSQQYGGVLSLPSRNVDAAHLESHEKAITTSLAEAFSREFDPEIATFAPAEPLEPGAGPLPAVTAPTLVLSYGVEPSGATFANKKPRYVLVGLVLAVQSAFLLPGDDEPLRLTHTVATGVPLRVVLDHKEPAPRGTLERDAYAAMVGKLFDDARQRYLAAWFSQRP